MGRAKKLSAEEEEALRREEREAVRAAYLSIFKEARSRQAKAALGASISSQSSGNSSTANGNNGSLKPLFPIPTQPHRTRLLGNPTDVLKQTNKFDRKVRQCMATSLTSLRSRGIAPRKHGPASICITAPGTQEEVANDMQPFVDVFLLLWHDKPESLLDELIANLVFPIPSTDTKSLIADLAQGLKETHAESEPVSISSLEHLVLCLFTMEAPDIDRFLAFPDAPPPFEPNVSTIQEAWAQYTPRNVAIHSEVTLACTDLFKDPSNPDNVASARRWVKTIGVLIGLAEGFPRTKLHKGVWKAKLDVALLSNSHVGWVPPASFSASKQIAEGIVDDGGGGALFNVVSDRGISLAAFSQYPEEEEVLLPLCSVLKVISVTPGQDGQVSVINADLVCALTHRREIMRFQSLAVAEARLEGEWLTKLALLRKSDETVSPQSSEDSGVSSDDDGEFLSESEINGIAELVRSATLGSIRPADDDYDDSPLLENRQNRGHQDQARSNQTPSQATTELEKAAIQSQGPAFDTNTLADDQTTRDLCLRMRSEYLLKKGDVVDELVSNLRTVHPRGTIEHKREVTQRLSILCKLLWDKTRDVEEVKGLTSVELLVGWLYTSHGVDVDRLMGFNVPGFPDPSDPCHAEKMQAWASYTSEHRTDNPDPEKRTRNGTLFKDVNWALRREGTRHKSDPRAGALIKKWCKYIGSLQAILSRPLLRQPDSGLLYRGFGGQSEGVFLHYKNTAPRDALFWTAFSSCTANRPIALRYITGGQANARAKVGHAFLFFVSKIKAGLAMGPVSQYPQEDEITMPLSALTVVDTGEDVALSKELTSTIQVNLLSEVRLKPENDGKTEEELQSIVQRRLEESPLRTAVVQVEVKSAFAVEIVNDLLYFARADARRASRRMLRLYGFVQRAEHPTPLGLAREELLDATEDFEAKDFEGLFALPPRPANVAFNAVEGLRWVFEPQGRETVMVTDALDRIAGNKGPHGLRDRLCQWTADCTKRDDLPDETATKRRLHAFARSRKTRPDILRRDFPELEALSRWLRAVHNYAVELIEVVRQNTQATALKVEKKRQKQKVEAA